MNPNPALSEERRVYSGSNKYVHGAFERAIAQHADQTKLSTPPTGHTTHTEQTIGKQALNTKLLILSQTNLERREDLSWYSMVTYEECLTTARASTCKDGGENGAVASRKP